MQAAGVTHYDLFTKSAQSTLLTIPTILSYRIIKAIMNAISDRKNLSAGGILIGETSSILIALLITFALYHTITAQHTGNVAASSSALIIAKACALPLCTYAGIKNITKHIQLSGKYISENSIIKMMDLINQILRDAERADSELAEIEKLQKQLEMRQLKYQTLRGF